MTRSSNATVRLPSPRRGRSMRATAPTWDDITSTTTNEPSRVVLNSLRCAGPGGHRHLRQRIRLQPEHHDCRYHAAEHHLRGRTRSWNVAIRLPSPGRCAVDACDGTNVVISPCSAQRHRPSPRCPGLTNVGGPGAPPTPAATASLQPDHNHCRYDPAEPDLCGRSDRRVRPAVCLHAAHGDRCVRRHQRGHRDHQHDDQHRHPRCPGLFTVRRTWRAHRHLHQRDVLQPDDHHRRYHAAEPDLCA